MVSEKPKCVLTNSAEAATSATLSETAEAVIFTAHLQKACSFRIALELPNSPEFVEKTVSLTAVAEP